MVDKEIRYPSRRQVLFMVGGATASLLLPGCGGSGAPSGPGQMVTKVLQLTLPSGLSSTGLTLYVGAAKFPAPKASTQVRVPKDFPSSVFLVDDATGKAVLAGVVNPDGTTNSLDGANTAASLIFIALGSSGLVPSQRALLWGKVVADPAVVAFASVVNARLAADPHAIANGDSQIKSAFDQAMGSLAADTIAASRGGGTEPNVSQYANPKVKSRGLDAQAPSPGVELDIRAQDQVGDLALAQYVDLDVNHYADYFQYNWPMPVEALIYVYDMVHVHGDGTETNLLEPALIGQSTLFRAPKLFHNDSEPISIALADANDTQRLVKTVVVAPQFDAQYGNEIIDAFPAEVSRWNTDLVPLRQSNAIQLTNLIFLEAIGFQALVSTHEQLMTQGEMYSASGGGLSTFQNAAGQGTGLSSIVKALLNSVAADQSTAVQVATALQPLTGDNPSTAASRAPQIMAAVNLWSIFGLIEQHQFSVLYDALLPSNAHGIKLVNVRDVPVNKIEYTFESSVTKYTAGGAAITIKVKPTALTSLRKFHWKLFGAGSSKISDGAGHTGTEFDSTKDTITLTPAANATGVLSVSCTIYNTEGGGKSVSGTAHQDFDSTTQGTYTFSSLLLAPGRTTNLTVLKDGVSNYDTTNYEFDWSVTDITTVGGFINGTSKTAVSTHSDIAFTTLASAEDGETVPVNCKVLKVDPNTGDFTSLASIDGVIKSDVGGGCHLAFLGGSFSLSSLSNSSAYRYCCFEVQA